MTGPVPVEGGATATAVRALVAGVPAGTLLRHRLVAADATGTRNGPDRAGGTAR